MATYTLTGNQLAAHKKTQTAATVDRVIIPFKNIDTIEVISDGAADLYVRVDGVDPVVDGASSFRLPSGSTTVRTIDVATSDAGADVRLISSGTPVWSVTAIPSGG